VIITLNVGRGKCIGDDSNAILDYSEFIDEVASGGVTHSNHPLDGIAESRRSLGHVVTGCHCVHVADSRGDYASENGRVSMMGVQNVDTFTPHERDQRRECSKRVPGILLRRADRHCHPPDVLAVE
jgi:hypothetical protein